MFSKVATTPLMRSRCAFRPTAPTIIRCIQTTPSKSVEKTEPKSGVSINVPLHAESSQDEASSWSKTLQDRFTVTMEVAVSKLLPAGAGWQTASVIAGDVGLQANELGFFAMTGFGDALGVGLGHTLYYSIKKNVYDNSINTTQEVQTALLLATATFFSGTAWQPAVNAFQSCDTSFMTAAVGTGIVTGSMFFTGLRVGRAMYSPGMQYVEENNYANLKADAKLSAAIGGATATFVGTDVSYGDANFLRPLVGVEDAMSAAEGVGRAGLSTALGFSAAQTLQNVVTPKGKSWLD